MSRRASIENRAPGLKCSVAARGLQASSICLGATNPLEFALPNAYSTTAVKRRQRLAARVPPCRGLQPAVLQSRGSPEGCSPFGGGYRGCPPEIPD